MLVDNVNEASPAYAWRLRGPPCGVAGALCLRVYLFRFFFSNENVLSKPVLFRMELGI